MPPPTVKLIARRQDDLHGGHPDYHVYAGVQIVGRIYKTHIHAADNWFWGVNGLTVDAEIGELHGNASSFDEAKVKLRVGFDRWLLWALDIKPVDFRYQRVAANLSKMGVL